MSTPHERNAEPPAGLYPAFLAIHQQSPARDWQRLLDLAAATTSRAFDGNDDGAEIQVQLTLYRLYAGRVLQPWSRHWRDLSGSRFEMLRETLEPAWHAHEQRRCAHLFGPPPPLDGFATWATRHCQAHRSNVHHPLFAYLRDTACFEALREFILQETPFDIHFGDILAMMLPGIEGTAKVEFSCNLWDEMGRGELALMHRQLRLEMTGRLDIPDDLHLSAPERFCLEELRLANMYFHAVFNRSLLPQAIGMMLATELMTSGRLACQIQGWRRVGLTQDDIRYLEIHTEVDVEHADGWMNAVVLPLLDSHPELMPAIVLGMARRLENAGAICDRMMELLPALQPARPQAQVFF